MSIYDSGLLRVEYFSRGLGIPIYRKWGENDEGDMVYQCPECNHTISTQKKCPECFEGCPLCGAEMEES